jgi:hypothetical protein
LVYRLHCTGCTEGGGRYRSTRATTAELLHVVLQGQT